ncbi:hypothetical protein VMCG_07736 [Cytospora schulzeri]|uniref:Uncharacterized protein n=1 Tax=Cytospora schulzeri TaxID=448051 RepID=A0A423VZ63_9PEZI|nr:hypothetical protein VMCG_07736 [Valsa malicola]
MAGPFDSGFELRGAYGEGQSNVANGGYAIQHQRYGSYAEQVSAPGTEEPKPVAYEVQAEQQPGYRLDWADSVAPRLERGVLEPLERPRRSQHDHEMAEVIAREDLDFFTALLEGRDSHLAKSRVKEFIEKEQRTKRRIQEDQVHEAHLRRKEESEVMHADMNFYLTLMQEG